MTPPAFSPVLAVVVVALVAPLTVRAAAEDPGVSITTAVTEPAETLTFQNRSIITFRATVQGNTPSERVRAAHRRLAALPANLGGATVRLAPVATGARGFLVMAHDELAFAIWDRDAEEGVKLEALATEVTRRLSEALDARREQRRLPVFLRGLARSAAASAILGVFLWLLTRLGRRFVDSLGRAAGARVERLEHRWGDLQTTLLSIIKVVVRLAFWVLLVAAVDLWLTFVLGCFPLTQPWARALEAQLLDILLGIGLAILGYLPSLAMLIAIYVVARFLAGVLKKFLERVDRGLLIIPGLHVETVGATRRIAVALVWLIALAAAFPYLPGASSEAFKGLSLLIGLMVSLGSTGIVAQAMSGLVVVYSRSLSKGDFVRLGEHDGVVAEVGLLSTKLVTIRGEEVTIPNTVVVGGPVRNFSRLSRDKGPLLSTTVSIGYDAPWRKVRALLLAAARRTSGLRADSEPFVLQRSLGDYYVVYELFVRLENPLDRPQVLDELHAAIQDAFNEAGVQIMSPHFVLQPEEPVVVPRDRWGDDAAPDAGPSRASTAAGERETG